MGSGIEGGLHRKRHAAAPPAHQGSDRLADVCLPDVRQTSARRLPSEGSADARPLGQLLKYRFLRSVGGMAVTSASRGVQYKQTVANGWAIGTNLGGEDGGHPTLAVCIYPSGAYHTTYAWVMQVGCIPETSPRAVGVKPHTLADTLFQRIRFRKQYTCGPSIWMG